MILFKNMLLPSSTPKVAEGESIPKTRNEQVNEEVSTAALNVDEKLVKAIHPFKASEDGELEFKMGDLIEVIERNEDGWWKGRVNDREGVFPANYVSPMSPLKSEPEQREESTEEAPKVELPQHSEEVKEEPTKPAPKRAAFSYLPPGGLQNVEMPVLRKAEPKEEKMGASAAAAPEATVENCGTCGCEEYKANVFRPGHCNNCFHKH